MHWIVQENLIHPATRDTLAGLLQERHTAYTLVKLVPFFHLLEEEIAHPHGPVFVYGSTGLGQVAKARGWCPGYVDANLDYQLMLERYGKLALNAGATCAPLGKLVFEHERFFIRPTLDNKAFAGTVMSWAELEQFRAGVARVQDERDVTLRLDDQVVVASLTEIWEEYRFFVIGGRVITGSGYKYGERVQSTAQVGTDITRFAEHCVDVWAPNNAFTIDIALTPAGLKVIELNSANSAGMYACDIGSIIDAVNTSL